MIIVAHNRHFGYKYSHFGEDTKGHDVKAFGDESGKYFEWDADEGKFGINGVDITPVSRIVKVAKVALAAADTEGGVFSWQNNEGASIIIQRIILDVTTKATEACTIDVGTTDTGATTSSNNLIDGLDVHSAAGVFDNIEDNGGAEGSGATKQKLANGKWVTASKAIGATAGLAGFAYIEYIVI
jgi:hypothetical protein